MRRWTSVALVRVVVEIIASIGPRPAGTFGDGDLQTRSKTRLESSKNYHFGTLEQSLDQIDRFV